MVATVDSDYSDRLQQALTHAQWDVSRLAARLNVSYQAVKKVLDRGSNALSASNNAYAALYLGVDPTWLAIGQGAMVPTKNWPFSAALLAAARRADAPALRRAENAARAALDMDMLAKEETQVAA